MRQQMARGMKQLTHVVVVHLHTLPFAIRWQLLSVHTIHLALPTAISPPKKLIHRQGVGQRMSDPPCYNGVM